MKTLKLEQAPPDVKAMLEEIGEEETLLALANDNGWDWEELRTDLRFALGKAPKLCPRCGSPCQYRNYCSGPRDEPRWCCTQCTWNEIDL